MMNSPAHRSRSFWSVLGRIAFVFAVAGLALVIAGLVSTRYLIRTLKPNGRLCELQEGMLAHLGTTCVTDVRVAAPSWLVTMARTGSSWIDLDREARMAVEAIHSAEVGVFELFESPDPDAFPRLIAQADEQLHGDGWERIVTVLEDSQMVLVYAPTKFESSKQIEACVIVLAERNLVAVNGRAFTEPLMELASSAMRHLEIQPPRI